jgi:hypothetical protein
MIFSMLCNLLVATAIAVFNDQNNEDFTYSTLPDSGTAS